MMEIVLKILENTSLWEVILLLIVVYVMFRPGIVNRITRFRVGDFELELSEIKKEIQEGKEKISELQSEIENEKKRFEELLYKFDANASLNELAPVRQALKSQSRNISDVEVFRKYLSKSSNPEELFAAAVGIREKRPVGLLPDIVLLLGDLAADKELGGFRLNTIWTLTSSIHKILISCVRDGAGPFPSIATLERAEQVLQQLEKNPRVLMDRPNDPMRGIRGPIKHSLNWIKKAKEKAKSSPALNTKPANESTETYPEH